MTAPGSRPQRSFLRTVGRTAGYNVLITGISAVTGVLLARWLGASGRGDYAATMAYLGLALIFFEVGLGSSVVYHVSRWRAVQADYVRTAAALLVPLAALAAVVAALVGVFLFGDSPARRGAFLVLPLSIAFCFAGAPPSFALQAINLGRWNLVRLVQPVSFLMLVIGAQLVTSLDVVLVVNLLAATFAGQTALAWWLYRRVAGDSGRRRRGYVRPLLKFGVLNLSSNAPNALNSRADQLLLAVLVSSAALGEYAVAVSLSVLAAPLIQAFGYVAFPGLARGEDIARTIRTSIRGAILVSVISLLIILAGGPFAIPLVFGPDYHSVTTILLVLAPGAAVVGVNQVLGDLLRGLGKPAAVALCEGFGVVFTIGGLLLLVPRLGVVGAAVTSTVTYLVVFALLLRSVSKSVQSAAEHPGVAPTSMEAG
ncbi:oligosaccharide flippase family protein [Aeromicrobium sp.]|uniref:oligosaccharide flippase family protein n=1 Tax=Aeromicrobium sp. TaxID=1871063 RepID=UPI0019C2C3DB|nr:oligosaccharide flippase family protein [Aeromicrobium sp.]MBC7632932.1 oligosaccharide flippase family protein [Aeromicrobium sp.]